MKENHKKIGDLLRYRADETPESPALFFEGRQYSYRELEKGTGALAVFLQKIGIGPGVHVGIWSINSDAYVFLYLALSTIGALPVLFNSHFREREFLETAEYSDIRFLFYDDVKEREAALSLLGASHAEIRCISMQVEIVPDRFLKNDYPDAEKPAPAWEALDPQTPACMLFTSGTTGHPKGVLLSHANIVLNAGAIAGGMGWGTSDRLCIAVPMFHCFGLTAGILASIHSGACMHVLSRFHSANVWNAVQSGGCTVLNGVPSLFLAMVRKKDFFALSGEGVRSGIIAGSYFSKEEYEEILHRFPNMLLQPSYGQTETSPCVTLSPLWEKPADKAVSGGRVIPGVSVRIADMEEQVIYHQHRGRSGPLCVLPGVPCGEIQVKGYNVMLGYYKMEEATRAAFTKDGWLKTGDVGYFDKENRLHILGRLQEIIIRGGENISPAEIEEQIQKIPDIKEVKVLGEETEVLQEKIVACIVVKEGAAVKDEEIMEFLKKRMAAYKLPERIVRFLGLPHTPLGKINISALRQMLEEGKSREHNKEGQEE